MTEKVDSFEKIGKLTDIKTGESKFLMTEEQERKNKEIEEKKEHDALKAEVEELKSIMKKDKKYKEGITKYTTIRVTTDVVNLLKLKKMGNESYEETILRIDDEAYISKVKLRKIRSLIEEEDENTIEKIKDVLELDDVLIPFIEEKNIIKSDLADRKEKRRKNVRERTKIIDYDEVEKKYDPDLTCAENARNIGISYASLYEWLISNGYATRKIPRIDYDEVEKKYDPDLTNAENARNIGISESALSAWRLEKGYPATRNIKSIDYNEIEAKYDPNLTADENARNMEISLSSYYKWRRDVEATEKKSDCRRD